MAKKIQSKLYTLSEIATLLSAKIDTNTRKKMHSVYKTLYNLVNQEKRNEYGREHGKLYRKKQSEKTKTALKLYRKLYNEKYKTEKQNYFRAYTEKNREKINKTVREWYRKKHNTPKTSYKKP